MMIKKLIALFMSFTVAFSVVQVNGIAAEKNLNNAETAILIGLGILEDDNIRKVNNSAFFAGLSGFFYDKSERTGMTAESFARGMGVLDSTERFDGSASLTVDKALEYAVLALGYKTEIIKSMGSDYKKIASDKKLTKGITYASGETLTAANMVTLFYNMLDAEPLSVEEASLDGLSYSVAENETLLSIHRNIYRYKGIVTANEYTSIYEENGVGEGRLSIDDEVFDTNLPYDAALLGKYSEAYVKENDKEDPCVIYISEVQSKNNTLSIDAEDIESVADDCLKIEYIDVNEIVRKAKISTSPKVIYNGIFYGAYTKADLMPDVGLIELTDNDNDGEYEIVKITAYQTMVVDSVDTKYRRITNKYSFDGCLDMLDLGEDIDDINCVVIKEDKKINFSQIAVNDVINVVMSKKQQDGLCTIYVSSEKTQTEFLSVNINEREAETKDDLLKISPDLIKELEHGNKTMITGNTYVIYLDYFENIAFYKAVVSNDYVLFYKMYSNESDDTYSIKYMNIDGEWKVAPVAEKVKFGTGSSDGKIDADVLYTHMSQEVPQVIKLTENIKGEVKSILIPEETAVSSETKFTKTPSASYAYRYQSMTFGSQIYVTEDTKLFVLPEKASTNTDDYYVDYLSGYVKSDTGYTICAYDIDDFGFTDLISMRDNVELRQSKMGRNMFVITAMDAAVSEDDEICTNLTGTGSGGLKDISLLTKNNDILADYKPGMVINLTTDRRGKVNEVRYVTDLNETFTPLNVSNYHTEYTMIKGTIVDIDSESGKIKLNCGTNICFPISQDMTCISYSKGKNECELVTIHDLKKGDQLVCRINYSKISEIIRVEK